MTGPSPERLSANVENTFTAPETFLLLEKAPEIYERFIKVKQADWRHQRRLAWADLLANLIGHMSGLAALVLLTAVAWHSIDRGYATQGASIICTGAVSIIAVFVTGRLTDRGKHGKATEGNPGSRKDRRRAAVIDDEEKRSLTR